ncbi:YycH family regulatory protein [Lapidilactobacillus achengensis]|uniref:YycH family regulatory protein n=1 Tax=Lapidilactobacillus achengensis TaxID=2486000 RepID=A0ABW1ULI6_9LACO|nr:two-component system activity regulator YycH [Lapidilactobacillus achengensis]
MRKTNLLVRFVLIVAILISLVLSYLIWTNNQRYERKSDTESTVTTALITNQQALSQVFLPTEVVKVDQKGNQQLVYNHKENLVLEIRKLMANWSYRSSHRSTKRYADLMALNGSVQLIYADQLSTQLFGEVAKQDSLKSATTDHAFDRIIFNLTGDLDHVYFLDDRTQSVWESRVSKADADPVATLINKCDFKVKVTQETLSGQPRLFFSDSVKLQPYSYLINRRNETTYISALMSSDNNANVESRESGGQTVYYGGGSYHNQLIVDHRSDQLEFVDNSRTTIPESLNRLQESGFTMLNSIGNPLTDIRYYDADNTKKTIAFRSFVEGFPIFQQSDFGAVKITFSRSGSHIKFSSRVLQVPVPAANGQVTLPATATILQKLIAAGYRKGEIQDLVVGYQWITDQEEADIVDLKPTYYAKINDRWQTYQTWINDKTQTEATN